MSTTFMRLECTQGGSNKFYELTLVQVRGGWVVAGLSDRIGQAGVSREVTPRAAPLSEAKAVRAMERFASKKIARGYTCVESRPATSGPTEYKFRVVPGCGGLRKALVPLRALARNCPEVADALQAFEAVPVARTPRWSGLSGEHSSDPVLAVALALCQRGTIELSVGKNLHSVGDLCTAAERQELVADLAGSRLHTLLVGLELIERPISNYAHAIGMAATALVL